MSFYKNRFDKSGQSSEMGEKAENLFQKLMEAKGYKVKGATVRENMNHIDFHVTNEKGETQTYDVKALKKVGRDDKAPQKELFWIELQSVNAKLGWLYSEDTNFIAFQFTESSFLLINRLELVKLVESKLQNKKVYSPEEALYKLYQRKGRDDLLTLVTRQDLLSVNHTILNP